jgi:hypothetical protein
MAQLLGRSALLLQALRWRRPTSEARQILLTGTAGLAAMPVKKWRGAAQKIQDKQVSGEASAIVGKIAIAEIRLRCGVLTGSTLAQVSASSLD